MKNVFVLQCPSCYSDQLEGVMDNGDWCCAKCGMEWDMQELDVTSMEVPE